MGRLQLFPNALCLGHGTLSTWCSGRCSHACVVARTLDHIKLEEAALFYRQREQQLLQGPGEPLRVQEESGAGAGWMNHLIAALRL